MGGRTLEANKVPSEPALRGAFSCARDTRRRLGAVIHLLDKRATAAESLMSRRRSLNYVYARFRELSGRLARAVQKLSAAGVVMNFFFFFVD